MKVDVLGARIQLINNNKVYHLLISNDECTPYWDDCSEDDFIEWYKKLGQSFEV